MLNASPSLSYSGIATIQLIRAYLNNNVDEVKTAIEQRANVNHPTDKLNNIEALKFNNFDKMTVLQHAVLSGNINMLQIFLERMPELLKRRILNEELEKFRLTILSLFIQKTKESIQEPEPIIKMLIQNGANTFTRVCGVNAMIIAIKENHVKALNCILNYWKEFDDKYLLKPDPATQDNLLHIAIEYGATHENIYKALLEFGLDPHHHNNQGVSPIELARKKAPALLNLLEKKTSAQISDINPTTMVSPSSTDTKHEVKDESISTKSEKKSMTVTERNAVNANIFRALFKLGEILNPSDQNKSTSRSSVQDNINTPKKLDESKASLVSQRSAPSKQSVPSKKSALSKKSIPTPQSITTTNQHEMKQIITPQITAWHCNFSQTSQKKIIVLFNNMFSQLQDIKETIRSKSQVMEECLRHVRQACKDLSNPNLSQMSNDKEVIRHIEKLFEAALVGLPAAHFMLRTIAKSDEKLKGWIYVFNNLLYANGFNVKTKLTVIDNLDEKFTKLSKQMIDFAKTYQDEKQIIFFQQENYREAANLGHAPSLLILAEQYKKAGNNEKAIEAYTALQTAGFPYQSEIGRLRAIRMQNEQNELNELRNIVAQIEASERKEEASVSLATKQNKVIPEPTYVSVSRSQRQTKAEKSKSSSNLTSSGLPNTNQLSHSQQISMAVNTAQTMTSNTTLKSKSLNADAKNSASSAAMAIEQQLQSQSSPPHSHANAEQTRQDGADEAKTQIVSKFNKTSESLATPWTGVVQLEPGMLFVPHLTQYTTMKLLEENTSSSSSSSSMMSTIELFRLSVDKEQKVSNDIMLQSKRPPQGSDETVISAISHNAGSRSQATLEVCSLLGVQVNSQERLALPNTSINTNLNESKTYTYAEFVEAYQANLPVINSTQVSAHTKMTKSHNPIKRQRSASIGCPGETSCSTVLLMLTTREQLKALGPIMLDDKEDKQKDLSSSTHPSHSSSWNRSAPSVSSASQSSTSLSSYRSSIPVMTTTSMGAISNATPMRA